MTFRLKEVYKSLLRLRLDAIEREMPDLAITYGFVCIQMGQRIIDDMIRNDERGD